MKYMNATEIDENKQLDIFDLDKVFVEKDYKDVDILNFNYSTESGGFRFDKSLPEIEDLYDGLTLQDINLIMAVEKE